jgi:predicted phosphate transport protein (TIGR00153 family)
MYPEGFDYFCACKSLLKDMSLLYKNVKQLIYDIDNFIDTVEQGVLVFKEGVINYLNDEKTSFADKIERIDRLEASADKLQRAIDDKFYRHSILPQNVSDIEGMLDQIDEIIDISKDNLYQFDDELPFFPQEIIPDYIRLADTSVEAALSVFPAVRAFFREPVKVRDMLNKVYFYEKETDKIARNIKRTLFHDYKDLKLSQKIHLRYFALHIETISDKAESLADTLSILALKMSI